MKRIIVWSIVCSVLTFAGRLKETVVFDVLPTVHAFTPFSAHVPESFSGEFVRFVHLKNRKSAVASVVSRGGDVFRTNPSLGEAIGISSKTADVFVEHVY